MRLESATFGEKGLVPSNRYLLSICIPTFNRARLLDQSIASIVESASFRSGLIQIVISDNNSSDHTKEVVEKYTSQSKHVTYHRNSTNIGFLNLAKVLQLGDGELLKLQNDYSLFLPGAIEQMVATVERHFEQKPVLFWGNGEILHIQSEETTDFDSFLRNVTYWLTFAGAFSIWRDTLSSLDMTSLDPLFPHITLFTQLSIRERFVVVGQHLFKYQTVPQKGGYKLFTAFGEHFLNIVLGLKSRGEISWSTYRLVRSRLMVHFLVPWYADAVLFNRTTYTFSSESIYKALRKHYGWSSMAKIYGLLVPQIAKRLLIKSLAILRLRPPK